jgi:hypothetical protein
MAFYIPKFDLAFIHIPKTGGTSILTWIKENFDYQKKCGKHCTIDKFILEFKMPKYYFTVVRNPYHRLLSWYFYQGKMLDYRKQKNKPRPTDYEIQNIFDLGFNEAFMDSPNALFDKTILTSQTEFFNKDITFILKQENLNQDFIKIQQLTNTFKELDKINTSSNNNNIKILNSQVKEKINSYFSKDFDYLGYDYETP